MNKVFLFFFNILAIIVNQFHSIHLHLTFLKPIVSKFHPVWVPFFAKNLCFLERKYYIKLKLFPFRFHSQCSLVFHFPAAISVEFVVFQSKVGFYPITLILHDIRHGETYYKPWFFLIMSFPASLCWGVVDYLTLSGLTSASYVED